MSCRAIVLPTNAPVGFRFSPTEEEVINHYLKLKYQGKNDVVDPVMATVDFCAFEPWELPRKSMIESNDQVWWFFCPRDYKYNNSRRSNRTTKSGYWKITGKGQKIKSINGVIIGGKRILVFHRSPCPGQGTEWVMHEYHLEPENPKPNQKSYVVCRLERKTDEKALKTTSPDYETGQPSGGNTPDDDHQLSGKFQFPGVNQLNLESLLLPQNSRNDNFGFLTGNQDSFGDVKADHDFVDSLIVDPEENDIGATAKRVYFQDGPDSSDTDNERIMQALQSSGSIGLREDSKRVRHMQMASTPSETHHTYMVGNAGQETIVGGHFSEEDTSSDDFTPAREINRRTFGSIDISFDEDEISARRGVRLQPPLKVSNVADPGNKARDAAKHSVTSVHRPGKESNEEPENVRKKAHISSSSSGEYVLQAGGVPTVSSKWKSFFTFEETPTVLSCDTTPPSVYLLNMVVGVVLFLVFVRELVLFGSC
ncbi:hypothetical protein F8388_003694 [Cannabis sativa]|uniref:NAC domain-containing protein n=1 Tax=Cannabis sativa TaxID=3483 RepID=A0A7J6F717_CANSA|nr:hypothetical protein F8388_003694 [Cannabis sativa]